MKTLLASLLLMTTAVFQAQTFDARKYIEVTGSAEMTIQPDEIRPQIVLADNKKVGARKITDIEADFNAILRSNNIDPKSVKFDNASSWYSYWKTRHQNSRTVTVTLNKDTDILKLVKDLDKYWVDSISIVDSDHKDLPTFRKEVKIQAIKAAKEKAAYLLESVSEKVGGIISVHEIPDSRNDRVLLQSNWVGNAALESARENGIDNVADIKLRYEIIVKFEIE
jgi:uncharacterized protein YggE